MKRKLNTKTSANTKKCAILLPLTIYLSFLVGCQNTELSINNENDKQQKEYAEINQEKQDDSEAENIENIETRRKCGDKCHTIPNSLYNLFRYCLLAAALCRSSMRPRFSRFSLSAAKRDSPFCMPRFSYLSNNSHIVIPPLFSDPYRPPVYKCRKVHDVRVFPAVINCMFGL